LKKLNDWNRRRREVAAVYREELKSLPLTMQAQTGMSNYHIFAITVPERDKLRAHLAEEGIPTLVHYPVPLHRQKAFAEFNPARCPNADVVCSRVLSLPMHAFLTDGEVGRVVEGVRSFFKRHREKKSEG
jgi:dTDP-4-amino-4,6-dideoxygalactose transaminase